MTKQTNAPALRANMEAFLKGSEGAEGGRAAMSLDLVAYLNTPIVYLYANKDGTEYMDDFAVKDIVLAKPRNEDGSESKVVQGHRREALLCNVFGFQSYAVPSRMRSAIDKLIPEAIAIKHYFTREDGSLSIRMGKVPGDLDKTSRRVIGGIAASDMFALVDDEGKLTMLGRKSMRMFPAIYRAHNKRDARDDTELESFMLAYEVEADGRASSLFDGSKALTSAQFLDKLVVSARAEGIIPALVARDTKGKVDKGNDLKASAALVLASIDTVMVSDESDIEFSPDLGTVLDAVAERWAAYRCRFPVSMLDL
jgi:hypothetical protein